MSSDGHQPKLRKSCDLCASTKVGCSKDKPVCSRCAKRGLRCSYSTARRVARSTSSVLQDMATHDRPAVPRSRSMNSTHQNVSPASDFGYTLQEMPPPPRPSTTQAIDFGGPSFSQDDLGSLPALDFSDLDELFASMQNCPPDGMIDADGQDFRFFDTPIDSNHPNTNGPNYSNSSRSLSSSDLVASSSGNSLPSLASPRGNVTTVATSGDSNGGSVAAVLKSCLDLMLVASDTLLGHNHNNGDSISCQCLTRAVNLSRLLSARSSRSDHISSGDLSECQSIIAQNEAAIDQIRVTLQCSCLNDSDLLVTLSLLIFKLIARYSYVTHALSRQRLELPNEKSSSGRPASPPFFATLYDHKQTQGEDKQRLAMQFILSKLTNVQLLIELLSHHLRGRSISWANAPDQSMSSISNATQNMSTELACTLQVDLRKRLQELSQTIIERLREV